jgi:hypothetical protein
MTVAAALHEEQRGGRRDGTAVRPEQRERGAAPFRQDDVAEVELLALREGELAVEARGAELDRDRELVVASQHRADLEAIVLGPCGGRGVELVLALGPHLLRPDHGAGVVQHATDHEGGRLAAHHELDLGSAGEKRSGLGPDQRLVPIRGPEEDVEGRLREIRQDEGAALVRDGMGPT